MKTSISIFLLLFGFTFHLTTYSQTATNFEVVDSLLKESVTTVIAELKGNNSYYLNFSGADDYSVLEERLKFHFRNEGIEFSEKNRGTGKIFYTLAEARTTYSDLFHDGLFGNYLIERRISLNASFYLNDVGNSVEQKEIFISSIDTVLYSDYSKIENVAYSFTSSELPDEPLFSSTLEPIIAIGTAAVAVYLFFNIRSK